MGTDATFDWGDLDAVAGPVRGEADLVLGRRVHERRESGAMPWHAALANALLGRRCGRLAWVGPTSAVPPSVATPSWAWACGTAPTAGPADEPGAAVPSRHGAAPGRQRARAPLATAGLAALIIAAEALLVGGTALALDGSRVGRPLACGGLKIHT